MQRIKSLKLRQRIFDDLAQIDPVDIHQKCVLTDEQFKCFCTVEGISDQIDSHLEAKNMVGLIYWMDPAGVIIKAAADFDFIP